MLSKCLESIIVVVVALIVVLGRSCTSRLRPLPSNSTSSYWPPTRNYCTPRTRLRHASGCRELIICLFDEKGKGRLGNRGFIRSFYSNIKRLSCISLRCGLHFRGKLLRASESEQKCLRADPAGPGARRQPHSDLRGGCGLRVSNSD